MQGITHLYHLKDDRPKNRGEGRVPGYEPVDHIPYNGSERNACHPDQAK